MLLAVKRSSFRNQVKLEKGEERKNFTVVELAAFFSAQKTFGSFSLLWKSGSIGSFGSISGSSSIGGSSSFGRSGSITWVPICVDKSSLLFIITFIFFPTQLGSRFFSGKVRVALRACDRGPWTLNNDKLGQIRTKYLFEWSEKNGPRVKKIFKRGAEMSSANEH